MANSVYFQNQELSRTLERKARWIYWTLTTPFVLTMIVAGVLLLAGATPNVEGITHLGYPVYICKILGTAKVLAGMAILYGRFPVLKEWAYAGYTFNLLGASASYALHGDALGKILVPAIILIFVLTSYRMWKNALDMKEN